MSTLGKKRLNSAIKKYGGTSNFKAMKAVNNTVECVRTS